MYIHCSNKPSLRCLLCSGKWAVLEREHLQPLESSKAWLHMVIKISPLKTSEQVNSQDYPFNVGQVWTIWRQRSCYHVLLPPSLGWFPPAPQWMESVHSPLRASPPDRCMGKGSAFLLCSTSCSVLRLVYCSLLAGFPSDLCVGKMSFH